MAAELRQHFIRVAVRNRTEVSLVELLILAAPNALHNELRVPVVLLERAANLHDVICLEESGNLFGTVHTRPWIRRSYRLAASEGKPRLTFLAEVHVLSLPPEM